MRRTMLIPAALAVALLLAGCTGGGTPTPSSTASGAAAASGGASEDTGAGAAEGSGLSAAAVAKDACSVMTAEEAAAASGSGITRAEGEGGSCAYSGTGHGFLITYESGGDTMWDIIHTDGTPTIQGIGERAEGSGGRLLFQKGTFVVDIVEGSGDASSASEVAGLAEAIAAKL